MDRLLRACVMSGIAIAFLVAVGCDGSLAFAQGADANSIRRFSPISANPRHRREDLAVTDATCTARKRAVAAAHDLTGCLPRA
jgi:hypothetical protein